MAFTSAETTKIRHYLGYPQVYRFANPRLEGAIQVVGTDADAVTMVQALLAKVDGVRATLDDALDNAGLKGLGQGEVEFYDASELDTKRSIGRSYCAELSGLFGVPLCTDIFGTQGYSGDGWRGSNGMSRLTGLG